MQNKNDSLGQEGANQLEGLRREILNGGASLESDQGSFDELTMKVFRFQAKYNPVYANFIGLLGLDAHQIQNAQDIPFLPVEVFQHHVVSVFGAQALSFEHFKSSGTTGSRPSIHYVDDLNWYNQMALKGYQTWKGSETSRSIFIGLLPGYVERSDSSLVHMVRQFMVVHGQERPDDWFFLNDFEALERRLEELAHRNSNSSEPTHVTIIGVTHALLRWAERWENKKPDWLNKLSIEIVETGGMKGMGPELLREEVHQRLLPLSSQTSIGSEYGMTELLSQAWSRSGGQFECPPWMHVKLGSLTDPGEWVDLGRQGRIHVIDLANIASCSFLATGDIGRMNSNRMFEILGRFDHAEVRGCNLMAAGPGS